MTDKPNLTVIPLKPSVNENLVRETEALLERIKDGQVADLAYAHANRDGTLNYFVSASDDAPRQLAAIARLLHRAHRAMDDNTTKVPPV